MHVLYVEDWPWMEQESALCIYLQISVEKTYGEEKYNIKFRLAICWTY